jgi:N-dimethylarginine dimethylaminohydrolase
LSSSRHPTRVARQRHFLMCEPTHFDVLYSINPWMVPGVPVDREVAHDQWDALRRLLESLGARVEVMKGVEGLPDMVFAANAGTVVDGVCLPARFLHPERQGEEPVFRQWFTDHGYRCEPDVPPLNEGEGDFRLVGDVLYAGTGPRSGSAALVVAELTLGRPTVELVLVDDRFYHLDTALAVLDDTTVAYYPPAFAEESRTVLEERFPDAVIATDDDAAAFGLNAVSDGRNVVLPAGADQLCAEVEARGFVVHEVAMSEFIKAGGAAKCCVLELRP